MHPNVLAIVQKRGLSSLMNKTKWIELANALSKIGPNGPICSDKFIDREEIEGPCYISWGEFFQFPTERYEWLEIHSCEYLHQGQLIESKVIDHSVKIEMVLRFLRVPFSKSDNGYRVWGYVDPLNQPAYA